MDDAVSRTAAWLTPAGPDKDEQATEASIDYAIVEIFGHRRHVGRIIEIERFGAKMLRVDVPKEGDFAKGFVSHVYGGAAIFCITPCDADTVRRTNARVEEYGQYRLPPPSDDDEDDEDEQSF